MKTIPKNVKKAFLVASFMGSVLKAHTTGTPKLTALHIRIDQGMKRYSIIAGKKAYHELTSVGFEMWKSLAEKHSTKLTHPETEVFIEYMGYLMSENDYKNFLGFTQFKSCESVSDETLVKLCNSLIELGSLIDNHLGTKPCLSQLKVVKVKKKVVRDVSNKRSKHDKEVAAHIVVKKKKKSNLASLRERAALARKVG